MAENRPKSLELVERQFRLLRQMALDTTSGVDLKDILTSALEQSLALTKVEAGAVTLWGPDSRVEWSVAAGDEGCTARLKELETELLADLRTRYGVRSLYMTLDGEEGPAGVFSYPLKAGRTLYGAISGLARGERNLAIEEEFISATAALMTLAAERQRLSQPAQTDTIKAARSEAIAETVVTINHEINNPLTAISGNLQLLLSRAGDLPPEVVRLLKKIEEGADRILEVTRKLRSLTTDRTVSYHGDIKMLDLDDSPQPRPKDGA